MKVGILTSIPVGAAGAALPVVAAADGVDMRCVIVSAGAPMSRQRSLRRKLRKTLKIGLLGVLNGLRLRRWYRETHFEDVRAEAARLGIPVVEVQGVNWPETIEAMRRFELDLCISIGNPYISPRVYETPTFGMINFHGELLPEYAGGLSVVWPIYFGLTKTGLTIHRINKGIDTGPILLRREFDIVFAPTLRETVEATSRIVRSELPGAMAEVVSNWDRYASAASPNAVTRSFTTPTIGQFARMWRNHRALYKAERRAAAGREENGRVAS